MNIRCKECSKAIFIRNTRGTRIADMTCSCGGRLESLRAQYTYFEHSEKLMYQGKTAYYELEKGIYRPFPNPVFRYLVQTQYGDNAAKGYFGIKDVTSLSIREVARLCNQLYRDSPDYFGVTDRLFTYKLEEKSFVNKLLIS